MLNRNDGKFNVTRQQPDDRQVVEKPVGCGVWLQLTSINVQLSKVIHENMNAI